MTTINVKDQVVELISREDFYHGNMAEYLLKANLVDEDEKKYRLELTFGTLYFHELSFLVTTLGLEDVLILGCQDHDKKYRTDVLLEGYLLKEDRSPLLKLL